MRLLVSRIHHLMQTSLSAVYYAHILSAPSWYLTTLASLSGAALVAALLKLILGGASGMFGGASFCESCFCHSSHDLCERVLILDATNYKVLLSSALSVYIANARAALMFLPLDKMPSSSTPLDMRLTEALQSLAASHMIIAVCSRFIFYFSH